MMDYHFIHLLIVDNQIHSTLLIESIVLNFPEETSWSTQALMCILILLYHVRTMFSCVDFGIHHLLSLRQCLFEKGVSSRYSVTIRTLVLKVKWYHSQGSFVLPGCMVDFHEEITILFSKRNSGWFMNCQAITRNLDHSGTSPRPAGMDVKWPLGHLCSV